MLCLVQKQNKFFFEASIKNKISGKRSEEPPAMLFGSSTLAKQIIAVLDSLSWT
jgi:hypothetical protein